MTQLQNVDPEEIAEKYRNAEDGSKRAEARNDLYQIDSGRWNDLLKQAHTHFSHAGLTARDHLEEMYSDEFLVWVGVYGLIQDLNTFGDITGVERQR